MPDNLKLKLIVQTIKKTMGKIIQSMCQLQI